MYKKFFLIIFPVVIHVNAESCLDNRQPSGIEKPVVFCRSRPHYLKRADRGDGTTDGLVNRKIFIVAVHYLEYCLPYFLTDENAFSRVDYHSRVSRGIYNNYFCISL